eukprot:CAMPEP_0176506138 /NCGR_PEP_ID=MMETSP0200_2-20121128/16873_1 /TAXON_ID=947934 /ORGANISM="Chaetoceros sp., Strain GSL56" /LENGTH=213 /DNA_ID=CAMNT_0017905749 /DNA_START=173 /DNA_END=811 /DNA_ORIENTATION=+
MKSTFTASLLIVLASNPFFQRSTFVSSFTTSSYLPTQSLVTTITKHNVALVMSSNDYNNDQVQVVGQDKNLSSDLQFIPGIHAISSSYDTFLLDMWGVMHNGSKPYDGVIHTVQKLKQAGKKMIILSNSSKRIDDAEKVLAKLGFDISAFDQIITSGEISYRMLCGDDTLQCSKWDVLVNLIQEDKRKVFVFGSGDGDEEYVESCGWSLASID